MRRRLRVALSIFSSLAGWLSLINQGLRAIPPALIAPFFTAAGIVQAATQTAETLAPNTIATIYGTQPFLDDPRSSTAADFEHGGTLPTSLDGVSVFVHDINCNLSTYRPARSIS